MLVLALVQRVRKGTDALYLAHTTGLPSTGIFTPNTSRAAMLRARAAFQSPGGKRPLRILVSCCIVQVANAVIDTLS
jgi:hypothetical protein